MASSQQRILRRTDIFERLLGAEGLSFELSYPWLVHGIARQVQGWKLHVSSTPSQGHLLLRVLLPRLRSVGVPFKVAASADVLSSLNEGGFGATQVGKFVTIYPDSTADAVELASQLIRDLDGFDGPAIPTDLSLGTVVYARYGGINPHIIRDALGQTHLWIEDLNGGLVPDAYAVPFELPAGVPNPFMNIPSKVAVPDRPLQLADLGFVLLDRVRSQPKGDVWIALDMRHRGKVAAKVVKQGRRHSLSDEFGRDMVSRLRRQYQIHKALAGLVDIPIADAYVEVENDAYLVLDRISGQTLEIFIRQLLGGRGWLELTAAAQAELLATMHTVAESVAKLHKQGFVHRDLSPSNIVVTAPTSITIVDMELAYEMDQVAAPFSRGTDGFISPNQQAHGKPSLKDDIYSLGCLLLLSATGLDPRFIPVSRLGSNDPDEAAVLFAGVPANFRELTIRCLANEPNSRPDCLEVVETIRICCVEHRASVPESPPVHLASTYERFPSSDQLRSVVAAAADGILTRSCSRDVDGLWLSSAIDGQHQSRRFAPALYRWAHKGVSGPLYTLAAAVRTGSIVPTDDLKTRIQTVTDWLVESQAPEDIEMPGLHFGEAGVALAVSEVIEAGIITRSEPLQCLVNRAFSGQPKLFDITHGAAGVGLGAMACTECWPTASWLSAAKVSAERLVAGQSGDGSWVVPSGVPGMSGETLTGYAHGAAGIIAFLAVYCRRCGDTAAYNAVERGTQWLLGKGMYGSDGSVNWSYSDRNPANWLWWCHGAPGIALGLMHAFRLTGDEDAAKAAKAALRVHPLHPRYPNLSQCHGLAGLGEIYLEAFEVFGEEEWLHRAGEIIKMILSLSQREDNGSVTWLVENAEVPVADLMVGSSGILHLLVRALHHEKRHQIGFPLFSAKLSR